MLWPTPVPDQQTSAADDSVIRRFCLSLLANCGIIYEDIMEAGGRAVADFWNRPRVRHCGL